MEESSGDDVGGRNDADLIGEDAAQCSAGSVSCEDDADSVLEEGGASDV